MPATLVRNIALATALGVVAFFADRFIMFPDMTQSATTGLRGGVFGVVMLMLLVGALRWTGCPWIGVGIPFGMAIAMEYIVRHSGTNSDGLEGVGEFMTVVGGLCVVFAVTQTVRYGMLGVTSPPDDDVDEGTSTT
jgi:peptidoglycan/LPS O-acetylase OafA/YrhL